MDEKGVEGKDWNEFFETLVSCFKTLVAQNKEPIATLLPYLRNKK
jgi:hypothetical protein